MKPDPDMTTKTLAGWFGSDRMVAKGIGEAMKGCTLVAIGCAGGMSVVPYLDARTVLANDVHRPVINLASVCKDQVLGPKLYRAVRRLPLHPEVLSEAQARCREREGMTPASAGGLFAANHASKTPDLQAAIDYFVCCWMGRGATSGTPGEFTGGMSIRYDDGGGDSAARYRSACSSIRAWRRTLRRCTFSTDDVFDFLARVGDQPKHGIYIDPPWIGPGDAYASRFTLVQHRYLALILAGYRKARVVVRHSVHPLYEELYPRDRWDWTIGNGRDQVNQKKSEALIVSRGAA